MTIRHRQMIRQMIRLVDGQTIRQAIRITQQVAGAGRQVKRCRSLVTVHGEVGGAQLLAGFQSGNCQSGD